jgi:hypothetical protein
MKKNNLNMTIQPAGEKDVIRMLKICLFLNINIAFHILPVVKTAHPGLHIFF